MLRFSSESKDQGAQKDKDGNRKAQQKIAFEVPQDVRREKARSAENQRRNPADVMSQFVEKQNRGRYRDEGDYERKQIDRSEGETKKGKKLLTMPIPVVLHVEAAVGHRVVDPV